jgi:ABC-type transport system involved in cytochrome c biogenesis permease subunit
MGTDFVLETLGVFPPQSEPALYTKGMLLAALIYRCVYTVAGGYVTARLALDKPMRHAIILGFVGIVAGSIGVAYAWNMSPEHWYPIALVVTALPCTWLGGKLRAK